ncbi:MAG: tetratricopeptide repeat protein [Rhodospirillales bacterium]|nr:tetratricopeptide repeat protein [Rhodospirillales bacterium]
MNRKQHRAQDKVARDTSEAPPADAASLQTLFNEARQLHVAGRLAEAESLYRRILATDANHADALHLLGVAAYQAGRADVGADLIGRAIGIDGNVAAYHSNRGNVLKALGRLDDALASFDAALRLKPDYAEALSNRGAVLQDLGRLDAALASYDAALRIRPDYADALSNRGAALQELGRLDDALASLDAALKIRPDFAEAHSNRGNTLQDLGRLEEALAAHDAALKIRPDYVKALCNRGVVLQDLGRLDAALASYDAALRIEPHHAEAHSNRGNVLQDLGRFDAALAAYDTALRIRPDYAEAHSNRLMSLHYMEQTASGAVLDRAREFGAQFDRRLPAAGFANVPDAARRLRVGYVSGDFGRHPVGYFLAPVLAHHNRTDVDVFCYSTFPRGDDLTARLRAGADHWRSLAGLGDRDAADLVRSDGIDLLIDLSGHTGHNRLTMFALRPAPIQVTWMGFWGTTGLSAMDFILSDGVTIRPDEEDHYVERVVRLPGSRFCYAPPDYAPEPAWRDGPVTFGSFNNLSKVGPEVVKLWAAVLAAVPNSRLLLKWRSLGDPGQRQRVSRMFAQAGIAAERLVLRGPSPHAAMLAEYGDMAIALDPFPFSGGLTTCEALWMGVPVVTLPGATAPSRQTQGFLASLGLNDWVARDGADYVRIAAGLAADPARIADLRKTLRPRMAASALCDGGKFTRDLEAAFRGLWRDWCGRSGARR